MLIALSLFASGVAYLECVWNVCRELRQWWLLFAPLEVNATLGDVCGIREYLLSSGKLNVSRLVPRLYRSVYKIIRLIKSITPGSQVVVTAVFQ